MAKTRIGICAPSTPIYEEEAQQLTAIAADSHPDAELVFHDQCFAIAGHFAGPDDLRTDALLSLANDPAIDAIWFARGGYGAARIAEPALAGLTSAAGEKTYMGYSDGGNLLGALYKAGIGAPAHGPMPVDIRRDNGDIAVRRALDWLVHRDKGALEPHVEPGQTYAAFNLMTLAMMVGTPLLPDLSGHVLMVEEIAEYHYAFDRALFNVTTHLADSGLAGLYLGRVSDVPVNNRPFGEETEEIASRWCDRTGIPWLGRADIGHDMENKIVPFGKLAA
ncbi:muramoyltetrapeptide carboxypeptidase [Parasphingorhabdus marina DSM 22363]|uniref:Muramoyltetrapeptide carboxypeptidase n=1 Tax=Parasphingorhabdus marina DSM 22363 TaxID=1123272 RepID=A0A1N6HTN7_9SPHN|nr:LD-carboxypeptidase [Parasphingorhabdus marina]SIO23152.1 muramoyltetrapeptide carboxypeptidase [Parasphingorhabdus marina DSM 22363]